MSRTLRQTLAIVLIGLALTVFVGGSLFLWLVPRQWEAIAQVHTEPKELDRLDRIAYSEQQGPFFIPTELEIISCQRVLRAVVTNRHLIERWPRLFPHEPPPSAVYEAAQRMRRYLAVVSSGDPGQIQIKVTTRDSAESVEIANAIATTYVRVRIEALSRRWGEAANKLVAISHLASLPTRPAYPPPLLPWVVLSVTILTGGTGLFLLGKSSR